MPAAPYLTAEAATTRDDRLASFEAAPIDAQIASFEPIAERYRGVAYTPRDASKVFTAGCASSLILPNTRIRSVTSVVIDGATIDPANYQPGLSAGVIKSRSGWSYQSLTVTYTHGYDAPPGELLDACTEYVLSVLKSRASGVSRNTLSQGSPDGGTTRYSTPDWEAGRPTGWLEVDRLLNSLRDERFGLA